MARMKALLALAAFLLMLSAPAVAEPEWDVMSYANPKDAAKADPFAAQAWKQYVSEKSPSWGMAYKTYQAGDAKVLVMVGQENACDNGANSPNGDQNWSTCPLHVVVDKGGKVTTQTFQGACYNDGLATGQAGKPTKGDYVQSQFDPATRSLTVRTFQGGRLIPDCTKTLQVN
jgi:hypothetical protein